MLEEARDRKYNVYARVIQKAFKKYFARKRQEEQKEAAADLLYGHKERRRGSLNRNFVADYIGMDCRSQTTNIVGRREKVLFAEVVKKYDRRFKVNLTGNPFRSFMKITALLLFSFYRNYTLINNSIFFSLMSYSIVSLLKNIHTTWFLTFICFPFVTNLRDQMCRRDLILTGKFLYLIGREQVKKGPEKGKILEVVKRKLSFDQISHVSLSTLQVSYFTFWDIPRRCFQQFHFQ